MSHRKIFSSLDHGGLASFRLDRFLVRPFELKVGPNYPPVQERSNERYCSDRLFKNTCKHSITWRPLAYCIAESGWILIVKVASDTTALCDARDAPSSMMAAPAAATAERGET